MSDEPEPLPIHSAPAARTPSVLLREFLDARDVPCPACGYNLRALRAETCPECGQALELRVNLVEPRMRLWIAGMVALAAGAGFSTLLTLFAVFGPKGSAPFEFLAITIGGSVVEGAAVVVWLVRGRAIRKLGLGVRSVLVAACFALTLLNLVIFAANIR